MDTLKQNRGPGQASDDYDGLDSTTPLLTKTLAQTKSLRQHVAFALQNWFLWEIISAITASIAIAMIVVLLAVYDSSSLPDWPSSLTVGSTVLCDSRLVSN